MESLWGRHKISAIGTLILLAGVATYANSFKGVFLLDDSPWIVETPPKIADNLFSYLQLFYIAGMRNLVTISLAINYRLGHLDTWGYHAVNLFFHLGAGLALYGIVRRTLLTTKLRERFGAKSTPLAAAVAILFIVHPLQTESVTYIIQRAQSMMGFFQLLAMYCVVRGFDSNRKTGWHLGALLCCIFGLDVKPHMIGMPLLILWYDRTFISGSLRAALTRSKVLYLGLIWVWAVNVGNLARGLGGFDIGGRGANPDAAGGDMTKWEYASSQFYVVCLYIKLAFCPVGLCLDYTLPIVRGWMAIVPYAIVMIALGLFTVWGMARHTAWGFVGAWFFMNLGPTSSIIRRPDLAVEHRMYVPLAAIVVVQVVGGYVLLGWIAKRLALNTSSRMRGAACALGAVILGSFGLLTFMRNEDYRSNEAMWTDVVNKRPGNPRAHNNLGLEYLHQGKLDEAQSHFVEALKINPGYWQATYNLGLVFEARNKTEDAIKLYTSILQVDFPALKKSLVNAYNTVGLDLRKNGKLADAAIQFRNAINIDSKFWPAHFNLALILASSGSNEDSINEFKQTLELNPEYSEAQDQWAYVEVALAAKLESQQLWDSAVEHYTEAVRHKPDYADAVLKLAAAYKKRSELDVQSTALLKIADDALLALKAAPADQNVQYQAANTRNDAGFFLLNRGKFKDASAQFRTAISTMPTYWQAHFNLGICAERAGNTDEAIASFREAFKLCPSSDLARNQLVNALNTEGLVLRSKVYLSDAENCFRDAIKIDPNYWQAHYNLALVLHERHKMPDAINEYNKTIEINPAFKDAIKFRGEAQNELEKSKVPSHP